MCPKMQQDGNMDWIHELDEREKKSTSLFEKQRETFAKGIASILSNRQERRRDNNVHERSRTAGMEAEAGTVKENAYPRMSSPLPSPRWGPPRRALPLSLSSHERLTTSAEAILCQLLVTENYDTVNSFIYLYDAFICSQKPLYYVFNQYEPPLRAKKYSCVGLTLELIRRLRCLEPKFEGVTEATALLSCDEGVLDVPEYVSRSEGPQALFGAQKEHLVVGIQICIDGRPGIMLADPAYHVARIITIMADNSHPHTGWFTQSVKSKRRKEFNYTFNVLNSHYLEWHERETRSTVVKYQTSLIYVARPYLNAVNVTERRNLVHNFKSLVSRDQKGHIIAGLYFSIEAKGKDAQFTIFHDNGTQTIKKKYKFSTFTEPENSPKSAIEEIRVCNTQLNYNSGELMSMIRKLAELMNNQSFIDQMLEINEEISQTCL